ncbi:MAG TPA: hypothetical protein VM912_16155, partial [Terriglobales bacterium]|nr:hypothetical protein [Terriglobales bacterium]
ARLCQGAWVKPEFAGRIAAHTGSMSAVVPKEGANDATHFSGQSTRSSPPDPLWAFVSSGQLLLV